MKRAIAFIVFLVFPVVPFTATMAQGTPPALQYISYAGKQGFQELKIADGLYFVAFHGTRKASGAEVKAAWGVRVAQLCAAESARHFIPLKYPTERVLSSDPEMFARGPRFSARFQRAEYVYIPIFMGGPNPDASVDAPSTISHVRCVSDPDGAIDPQRLVSVLAVIQDGIKRRWIKETKK